MSMPVLGDHRICFGEMLSGWNRLVTHSHKLTASQNGNDDRAPNYSHSIRLFLHGCLTKAMDCAVAGRIPWGLHTSSELPKPKGHGSYIRTLPGPIPKIEYHVRPQYGPAIHDIDCSSLA